MQKKIKLSSYDEIVGSNQYSCYKIIFGTATIFLTEIREDGTHGRKFYVDEITPHDNIYIPSFNKINGSDNTTWSILISTTDEAIVESVDGVDIDTICAIYGKRLSINAVTKDELGCELVEKIQRKLFSEEVIIYKTEDEERRTKNEFFYEARSLFDKTITHMNSGESTSELYNSVEFLCNKNDIYIVPYDKLVQNCGRTFKLDDIARMSGFMIRDVYLNNSWYKTNSGLLLVYKKEENDEYIPVPCYSLKSRYYEYDIKNNKPIKIYSDEGYVKNAYTIYKPLQGQKLTNKEFLSFALSAIDVREIISLFVLSFIIMSVGLIIPLLYNVIYNKYIPMEFKTSIIQIGFLALAIGISNIFYMLYKNSIQCKNITNIENNIQSAIFNKLFNFRDDVYKENSCSELCTKAFEIPHALKVIVRGMISILISIILSAVYILVMYSHSPKYTKLAVAYVGAELIVILILGFKEIKYSNDIVESELKESAFLYQSLNGIEKIRVSGRENTFFSKYCKKFMSTCYIRDKKMRVQNLVECTKHIMEYMFVILIYYKMISDMVDMKIGTFISFLAVYDLFSKFILDIYNESINIGKSYHSLKRCKLFWNEEDEFSTRNGGITRILGNIEVNNVSFAYMESSKNILQDISLSIEKGEYIGIVGASGSGKSTLFKLLLGFYKPTNGKIYYDEKDVDELNIRELRRQLGVVLQDGDLISGSIYENITINNNDMTAEKYKLQAQSVEKVIKQVGLEDDINNMPMGVHTLISDGSGGISGGQKQRILIARAIFNDPQIVLFDEATSALDNITQDIICSNLEKMNVTRIVIAHRLNTVKWCNRIYVFDKGRVVESGSYEELMQNKSYFYDLVERQIV